MSCAALLLDRFPYCNPDSKHSIVLISVTLIGQDAKQFVKGNFVHHIVSVAANLNSERDYPMIHYFFKGLDMMAVASPALFFDQLRSVPDNEFSQTYIRRFFRNPTFSAIAANGLSEQFIGLSRFIGKVGKEFEQFPRLLVMTKCHIRSFVIDGIPDEHFAQIMFGMLMLLSSLNFMRQRAVPINELRLQLLETFRIFQKNTGIDVVRKSDLDISTDELFFESISNFVSFLPLLSHKAVELFVKHIGTLQKTPHNSTLCCVTAALLQNYWNSTAKLSQTVLNLFLSVLHEKGIPDSVAIHSIALGSAAFTFESIKEFSTENLQKLLVITIKTAKRSTRISISKSLEMLLNILRVAEQPFIAQHAGQILAALNAVISARRCDLAYVGFLNVIGEFAKKVQDPASFLKPDPISFHSLLPLLISDDPKIQQRALDIFAVLIFGSLKTIDIKLLFSSLMSLFFGLDRETTRYVAMATGLLEIIDREATVKGEWLDLLGDIMEPVLAVSDANCLQGLMSFLKFLKKMAKNEDIEISSKAMILMAHFAKPKQGFVSKKPG
jgi:hypothetical protein